MANTYTLISSNTLSSSAASVTFSAIPSTYTDLVLRFSARGQGTGTTGAGLTVRFNGSSAAAYSFTRVRGSGSTASSARSSSATGFPNDDAITDGGQTANTFANNELYIPNYTVSQNKPLSLFATMENNSSTDWQLIAYAGLWSNTAAITQINLTSNSGGFVSGSSFYLYGIKNS